MKVESSLFWTGVAGVVLSFGMAIYTHMTYVPTDLARPIGEQIAVPAVND